MSVVLWILFISLALHCEPGLEDGVVPELWSPGFPLMPLYICPQPFIACHPLFVVISLATVVTALTMPEGLPAAGLTLWACAPVTLAPIANFAVACPLLAYLPGTIGLAKL